MKVIKGAAAITSFCLAGCRTAGDAMELSKRRESDLWEENLDKHQLSQSLGRMEAAGVDCVTAPFRGAKACGLAMIGKGLIIPSPAYSRGGCELRIT